MRVELEQTLILWSSDLFVHKWSYRRLQCQILMNFARNPPCCTLTYLVHGEGGAIPQELGYLQQLRHWEATVPGSFTLFNLFGTEIRSFSVFCFGTPNRLAGWGSTCHFSGWSSNRTSIASWSKGQWPWKLCPHILIYLDPSGLQVPKLLDLVDSGHGYWL